MSVATANGRQMPHEEIFEAVAGCIEQCPFCKAQCELTLNTHSEVTRNIKHRAKHRPKCLGGYRLVSDSKMALDQIHHI